MSVPSGHADRSLHARFKQVSIAFFCHPVCAREMAVVDKLRTLRFLLRVKPEDHSDGFAPVGSLSLRVEQAKITRQMLVIVRSDAVQFGRSILKRRYRHDFPRGLLHYQRSNLHRGTRTFRGRQIGITQATTVYREGGLSYAATAHPPFCDAGSLPADYRARSAELERPRRTNITPSP